MPSGPHGTHQAPASFQPPTEAVGRACLIKNPRSLQGSRLPEFVVPKTVDSAAVTRSQGGWEMGWLVEARAPTSVTRFTGCGDLMYSITIRANNTVVYTQKLLRE